MSTDEGAAMNEISFDHLIETMVCDTDLHARWLNTLSMMENCGARKIAASQDPINVDYEILKHASEEARHAFFLKAQIKKVSAEPLDSYQRQQILGGTISRRYLDYLDAFTSRLLKQKQLSSSSLRMLAYLIVTYVIEVRAESLYPAYQQQLKARGSDINLHSLIMEEKSHLAAMTSRLSEELGSDWRQQLQPVFAFEQQLFLRWLKRLKISVGSRNIH